MSRWFRVYDDLVDDPKVQRLEPPLFKFLINVWCLASKGDGKLPSAGDISYRLRADESLVIASLEALVCLGLADRFSNQHGSWLAPHSWHKRQYKSDSSTERVKRFRNASKAVTETPPDTESESESESETDSEQNRKKDKNPVGYAFESGVIRLRKKDLDQWRMAFGHLELEAELLSLTEWAAKQAKWFPAVSGALAKKNREAKTRVDLAKSGNGHRRSPII